MGTNSGAFTSQIPVEVPAFHGIEPDLGLVYNSSTGSTETMPESAFNYHLLTRAVPTLQTGVDLATDVLHASDAVANLANAILGSPLTTGMDTSVSTEIVNLTPGATTMNSPPIQVEPSHIDIISGGGGGGFLHLFAPDPADLP